MNGGLNPRHRPISALSNFCLEVDRFRNQLGREISKDAAE
jgi:hypothetical protein